jgi:hypothetical protein
METFGQTWSYLVGIYVRYLGTISIICTIGAALLHIGYYLLKDYKLDLQGILSKAFAGYALPVGFALVLCSTAMEHLGSIENLELYIAAGGICFLYLTWVILFPQRP